MTYGEAAEALLVYPVIDGYARIDAGLVSDVVKMVKDLEKDNEHYLNHISMLQEKIRNGSEWISMEEKMPEPMESVLIYDHKNKRIAICRCGNCSAEDVGSFYSYWMPLPEPPKPKEPTFKDVFLKAFPKAKLYEKGNPRACCANVFNKKCIIGMKCSDCWSQPYFEEEGESGE